MVVQENCTEGGIGTQRGTQIILSFIAINVLWFTGLNVAVILYYERTVEEQTLDRALAVAKAAATDKSTVLPDYVVMSAKPVVDKNLHLLPVRAKGMFFYYDRTRLAEKVNLMAFILFGLETAFLLSLTLFAYFVVARFIKDREENERFLRLLLLAFNHKIRNFLTSARVNIEIIKDNPRDFTALKRLEETYLRVEKDMTRTLQVLKENAIGISQHFSLKEVIEEVLRSFQSELARKKVCMDMEEVTMYGVITDMEDIFHCLIDNVVRYSAENVEISLHKQGRSIQVRVGNDVALHAPKSTGLGLEIARRILKLYKGKLKVTENRLFLVTIVMPVGGYGKERDGGRRLLSF